LFFKVDFDDFKASRSFKPASYSQHGVSVLDLYSALSDTCSISDCPLHFGFFWKLSGVNQRENC